MWSAERWEWKKRRLAQSKQRQKKATANRARVITRRRRLESKETQRFSDRLRFDQHHIWDWNWAEDERRDLHSIPSWWDRFAHYCQLYGAWGFTARSRNGREVRMGTQIKEKT